jgi:preprotein translocase subunit SecF
MNNKIKFGISVIYSYLRIMKCQEVYFAIVLLLLLAMLVGCKQNGSSPSVELEDGSRVSFTALDSLADFNPDSADNLLSRSPLLR